MEFLWSIGALRALGIEAGSGQLVLTNHHMYERIEPPLCARAPVSDNARYQCESV